MSNPKIITLRLTLKGRQVRTFRFDKDLITLGRDPESDIYLDNPGISRKHLTVLRTPGGYYAVQDMKSANGTFMNGKRVEREYLTASDQISVGKYTMHVDYVEDQRMAAGAEDVPIPVPNHTTMLSQDELSRLIEEQAQAGSAKAPDLKLVASPKQGGDPQPWWSRPETWTALGVGIGLGLLLSRWI